MKLILAINAGSSSVKASLFSLPSPPGSSSSSTTPPTQLAEAEVSGLTAPPAKLSYTRGETTVHKGKAISAEDVSPPGSKSNSKSESKSESKSTSIDQASAFALLLRTLIDDTELTQLAGPQDVALVAHRIVHGGAYAAPQVVGRETLHRLDELAELAPLHNGPALGIVRACLAELPGARNVAVFDSVFHAGLAEHVRAYAIRQDGGGEGGGEEKGEGRKGAGGGGGTVLRKYGFHGISYAFISRAVGEFLGKGDEGVNIIALHLGSGASACAIRKGKSVDTSMGLTPLAGLPGATRSGSVDPSLIFHYASHASSLSPSSTSSLHITRAEEILNKQSGWAALTGTTDFGVIAASACSATPDAKHKLAFDLMADRVAAFVGSYFVALRGDVDALVFAGGIGERSGALRKAVVEQVACLGFELDEGVNGGKLAEGAVVDVGVKREGGKRVLVCRTDEQFEMARECGEDGRLWE